MVEKKSNRVKGKIKKLSLCFGIVLSLLLSFVLCLYYSVLQKVAFAAEEMSTDMTQYTTLTETEQTELNKTITEAWGEPVQANLTKLSNNFTAATFTAIKGDAWFYLEEDILSGLTNQVMVNREENTHIRILLNGYSISGFFGFVADTANVQISLFDRIPDENTTSGYKEGTGYTYNATANTTRYYQYNTTTQGYTQFFSYEPVGRNATELPTFQENSYIQVTGSVIAPNAKGGETTSCFMQTNAGTISLFNVNIVANTPMTNGYTFSVNSTGKLNLYQSSIIGNKVRYSVLDVNNAQSTVVLIASKIYGNCSNGRYGLQIANVNDNIKVSDVTVAGQGLLNLYKSNIGSFSNDTPSKTSTEEKKAVYLKNLYFSSSINGLSLSNFETQMRSNSNIIGTMELVYNINIIYNGRNENLNFVLYGGSQTANNFANDLKIATGAVVGNIATVFETAELPAGAIEIDGQTGSITTGGTLIILANANVGDVTVNAGGTATIYPGAVLRSGEIKGEGAVNKIPEEVPVVPPDDTVQTPIEEIVPVVVKKNNHLPLILGLSLSGFALVLVAAIFIVLWVRKSKVLPELPKKEPEKKEYNTSINELVHRYNKKQ